MDITLNPDGPHSPEHTRQVANALAEAVRVLNHATLNHADAALAYPADADSLIQALATAAMRLPQLFEQVTDWLAERQEDGRLAVTYGQWAGDPEEAVTQVASWLSEASEAAGKMYSALDQAWKVTATISAESSSEGEA